MTKHEACNWLQTFGGLLPAYRPACKHGHAGCSTTPGGECLSEVINYACLVWEDEEIRCETCGGDGEIDVSDPDPEAPAQFAPCPECRP